MSIHLNDLSKVYLEKVAESSHLETNMKKRAEDNEKARKDMMKTKAYKDMAAAARKKMEEGLDPVGQEDSDIDNDGDTDKSDKYLHKRRKAIGKAINKGKKVEEGFSNWREDLIEVIKSEKLPSKMKEGKVDNYSGKNKCVTINPEVTEQVQIIESVELSEEYINETVYGAVDYFMAEGLNDEGVEILIDELGLDEFVSFVFEVGNEVLTEARTLLGKKKNPQKLPKGTAPTQATKAAVAKYGTTRRFKSSSASGVVKKNRPAEKAVEKAKEAQPSKKPIRDAIARGVFGAVKAYQAGMQRHKAAMSAAKETGKTVAKAAAVTHEAGRRAGQSAAGQAIKKVGGAVIKAGVEKAKKDIKSLKKESFILDEKATSEQQQKLFGLALSVKRGQTPRSEASAEVLKIVDSMSEKKIRDFAKTKHEGIPKKVEEDLQPTTPQQVAAQQQLTTAQKKLTAANQQALRKQKPEVKKSVKDTEVQEGKIPVTRQAGEFRYSGKTGEEKAERRANVLSNSEDPQKRRQANTIRNKIKTVADRDTAQASSAARQKLYRGQQLRANDLAQQLIKSKSNVNAGYELEGDLVNETTPLFYKLQAKGKRGSLTASAQGRIDADLQRQKNEKIARQQTKQRQEREVDDDHPSLSARERNPNLR